MTTSLEITQADKEALNKCPNGWFDWTHDAVILLRCPRFRLDRLARRGLLEWKPQDGFGRTYRLTRQGRNVRAWRDSQV